MARYINLGDTKGRNAEVIFTNFTKKSSIKKQTTEGKEVFSQKILKYTSKNSYAALFNQFGDASKVANELINGNPEIDLAMTGRMIQGSSRLIIDKNLKPVSKITKKEVVYAPDGTITEERIPKELISNILGDMPVKLTGKLFPKNEIYNKLVFAKKYQLSHVNGLTFDFLFEIAKELSDKDSLMMLAAGAKSNEPLVFQDGGKSYRGFLEGRVKEGSYILLLHITNLELKAI
jgi:hypothetical protein